jgi:hypothetical protein
MFRARWRAPEGEQGILARSSKAGRLEEGEEEAEDEAQAQVGGKGMNPSTTAAIKKGKRRTATRTPAFMFFRTFQGIGEVDEAGSRPGGRRWDGSSSERSFEGKNLGW